MSFPTKTIRQITETLIDYRGKTPTKTASGTKLITAKVIKDGFIVDGNHEFIATDEYDSWMRRGLPKQWDILITTEAPLGEVAQLRSPERVALAQRVILLRGNPSVIDQSFYFHSLKSPFVQAGLRARSTGTTVLGIKQAELWNVEIPCPELTTQKRISSILSGYDDLIENNARRIQVLKAMSRTVFNGGSQSSSEPWNLVPIRELYEELFDGPHATPKPSTSGPIYLGIKNVTEQGELDLTDIRHIAEDDFPQWTRRVVPQSGDIVFTYEATLNRYGIIGGDFRGCLGRRMALIRPDKARIDSFLLLQCLLSNQWRDEVRSKTISGATVDRIPLTTFPSFQISIPGPEARRRIAPTIRACEELAENCRKRNDVLRKTRDLLLPKLVSGEVSVETIEEEALAETV
jgi:type I restriction enzyme, S subunit